MVNRTQQLLRSVLTDGPIEGNETSILALIDHMLLTVCEQLPCQGAFVIFSQQDNIVSPGLEVVDTATRSVFSHFTAPYKREASFNSSLANNIDLVDWLLTSTSALQCPRDITQFVQKQHTEVFLSHFDGMSLVQCSTSCAVGNVKVVMAALYLNQPKTVIPSTDTSQICLLDESAFQLASILELRRVATLVDKKDKQYQELFQQLPMACALIDTCNSVAMQNQVSSATLQLLEGQSLYSLVQEDDHALLTDTLHIVRTGVLRQAWCEVPLKTGNERHWFKFSFCQALNSQQQLLLMVEDITERYRLADELSFHSNHDSLTGLPNRLQFETMLEELMAEPEPIPASVAFLDLDQFQVINDLSGHQAGDQLLQQVAKRLKQLLRKGDVVARLGGDEFGILMYYSTEESAKQVAKRICQQLFDHEFVWKKLKHNISASIGIAEVQYDATDIYQVMGQADAACRLAKDEGRNRWHYFSPDDPQVHLLYNQMVASVDITGALALNQFELFYQLIEPLDKNESGMHMEILLRMVQADGQFVSPGIFLPAAERYNLASRVDRWVIDHLLKWGSANIDIWHELSMVSINLSAMSLADAKFMNWLEMRLMVEPELVSKLCFEITETAAVSQLEQATALIDLLAPLGCKLALDDFGSGFSSFAYLKCMDVDFVKIDGQFVVNLCSDKKDKAIVAAICQLGKDMDFEVVAEFVETPEIGRLLKELGVHYAQGYAINKPTQLSTLTSGLRTPWKID